MFRQLIVCLALLGAAPAVQAQPARAGSSGTVVAPQPANAMRLSRMLNPADKIVEAGDHAFKTGFKAALTNDQQTSAMFDQHPALLDAIFDGALPVVRKHLLASVPALQQKCASFYARRFTSSEIDQLIAFYGSPTGSKLVAGMYAGLDIGKFVEAYGPEGKDPVSGEAMQGVITSTAMRIMPVFNEADRRAFAEFSKTPLSLKVKAATPEMLKLMAEIANEPNPQLDAEVEQVVSRIIADYFAAADRAATSG